MVYCSPQHVLQITGIVHVSAVSALPISLLLTLKTNTPYRYEYWYLTIAGFMPTLNTLQ